MASDITYELSLFKRIGIKLLAMSFKLIRCTMRVEEETPEPPLPIDQPFILALWHNRLISLPMTLPKDILTKLHALTSRSRDGAYIAGYLGEFGIGAIRGSSSRGGARALIQLKKKLEEGGSISITPDGPRGPMYEVDDGIIWLASKTGVPIIPASFNTSSCWRLNSWDKTEIPKPFSKGSLRYGQPIKIDAELDDEGSEASKQKLKDALMALTSEG